MPLTSSQPHVTAVLDDERGTMRCAVCPMCHTSAALTQSALERGSGWRCARCGQQWDVARLATVAAYAAWVIERDRARASPRRSLSYDVPSEQLGGNT